MGTTEARNAGAVPWELLGSSVERGHKVQIMGSDCRQHLQAEQERLRAAIHSDDHMSVNMEHAAHRYYPLVHSRLLACHWFEAQNIEPPGSKIQSALWIAVGKICKLAKALSGCDITRVPIVGHDYNVARFVETL
jgi:hypothetical protein